jgi:hypothetical protein
MIVTVDRIEGEQAILEYPDDTVRPCPLSQLPEGTREGQKLEQTETGWQRRTDLEEEAKARIAAKLEKLKHKNPTFS